MASYKDVPLLQIHNVIFQLHYENLVKHEKYVPNCHEFVGYQMKYERELVNLLRRMF